MTKSKKYHHGNLRQKLLDEAKTMLASEGIEGLTLRGLAERAGVSRAAPYHHFQDKNALLCAIAESGFAELDGLISAAQCENDLKASLTALTHAYLRFARAAPETYSLMFGRQLWKMSEPTASLRDVAYGSFKKYYEVIAALLRRYGQEKDDKTVLRLAQASWASLHGLSQLSIDGVYVDDSDMDEVGDVAQQMLLRYLGESA